ncbi:MAG: hypothetical protein JXA82_02730 [Sedimentisphaerales bacterium]|nr:hypothetical protein [Sedimentisphaerales bacterium]
MKRWSVCAILTGLVAIAGSGCMEMQTQEPQIPIGFEPAYQQSFDTADSIGDFTFTDPSKWLLNDKGNGSKSLEFTGASDYTPPVRSPLTFGLIRGLKFGDFVLEADLLQTGEEYGHRDMCIIFGFQDPSHFYYVHMATKADANAHNIFIVNGAPRTNIAQKTTEGIDWGQEVWHKVRLERNIASGLIHVFYDDMTEPIMIAQDMTLGQGLIGFGSFDDSGRIDNIQIWAPVTIGTNRTYFQPK